jgi:two-component system, OmpR family, response regulator MtrA
MPRILIIDDNLSVLQAMEFFFETEGYEVLLASDGRLGLKLADESQVDVVMLDVEMPGISGIDVCRALRKNPSLAQLPVLMVTGRATREVIERATGAGADLVLAKPFDLDELRRAIPGLIAQAGGSVPVPEVQDR